MIRERLHITVRGAVQGVGFRPHVCALARTLALTGFVRNRGADVEIEAEGEAPRRLLEALSSAPPPQATIEHITCTTLARGSEADFCIAASVAPTVDDSLPRVLPDLVCCVDCVREIFDPASRYYRYPFTNCSHCGPRYSIQRAVPYDRLNTTMAAFTLCAACHAEYTDPRSRRFHAQPTACLACGPRLTLTDADGNASARDDGALRAAAALIRDGGILALKGLGGYQLLVDAQHEAAVARLRKRKQRPDKPFALMVRDLATARGLCYVDAAEAALLASAAGPIALLARSTDGLADNVAPGLATLGLMLPTTALHHLLLDLVAGPVICTSGNRAEEPIAIDDAEARTRLAGIADAWLSHDRAIHRPLDDSVARIIDGAPQVLRIGRGYAPVVLPYRSDMVVLACGGHLKNTVAVAGGARVVVSQHQGDLDHALTLDAMHAAVGDLCDFHAIAPALAAVDAHPDGIADFDGASRGLPHYAVQHHLAHALAVMLEHGLDGPLLAVIWDGTGFGTDGTAWGGEFLVVERRAGIRWRRVAHLRPYPLPGGDAAARDPLRALSGLLWLMPGYHALIPAAHRALLERRLNTPLTSSAGRLFDAVAAVAGFDARQSYEGQAACRLEHAARGAVASPYPLPASAGILDWAPLLDAALRDRAQGATAAALSAHFHAGLAAAIVSQAEHAGLETVILSGGCFQNRLLTEATLAGLRAAGLRPVIARRLPPHDGALAAGQAVAAGEGVLA